MSDDMEHQVRCCRTCKWDEGSKCGWPIPVWLEKFLSISCEDWVDWDYRGLGLWGSDETSRGLNCSTWEQEADHDS